MTIFKSKNLSLCLSCKDKGIKSIAVYNFNFFILEFFDFLVKNVKSVFTVFP